MLIIARGKSDSMKSTLYDGDQVLIDHAHQQATSDGICGSSRDNGLQIERAAIDPWSGLLTIISDKPNYARWERASPDSVESIGPVIWLGKQV